MSSLGSVPRLLIVHHSPTPSVAALTEAVVAGASDAAISGVEVVVVDVEVVVDVVVLVASDRSLAAARYSS